jgi:hypothetical protein
MESQVLSSLTLSEVLHYTTQVKIANVGDDQITVEYKLMPGNQPQSYGNFIAIWQDYNSIPWDTPPFRTKKIEQNTPIGSLDFDVPLENKSYIAGYAVGTELTTPKQVYGNICATDYLLANSTKGEDPITPSVAVNYIGTNSVSFIFSLPDGVLPLTNGAWAAIWRGKNPSYYGTAPMAASALRKDVSSGSSSFSNISLTRNTDYTIALFMSGYKDDGKSTQRALACSVSFNSNDPS